MRGNSRTSVLIAGVAILSIVALLGVQTWATVARDEMPLFSLVHAAPDGRVFVLLDGNLYVESPTGESLEVIPLSRFGVQHFEGDFAVLSDDSIILERGRVRGEEPLQRCALKTGECRELDGAGGESLQVGVAFRLAVDEPHQRIRVAYTAHHQVLLSDFEGRVLSRQFRSCRYPSAMARVAEDEFLVSDTRGARIVRVSGRDEDFGTELGQFSVQRWSAQPGHTRPKGVAITGDGTRWIVMTDENIGNGELYRLGRDASTPTRIPLPENTDTMFPEALADSVLLPDGGVYRIHRFTLDGTRMSDFGSPELKARLAGFATRTRTLGFVFKGSYIGLLLVSLPMLIAALWMQRKAAAAEDRVLGPVESQAGGGEPYRNPESSLRELRGEYLFQRRFTVLDAREVRRVGLLMGGALCVVLPAAAAHAGGRHGRPPSPRRLELGAHRLVPGSGDRGAGLYGGLALPMSQARAPVARCAGPPLCLVLQRAARAAPSSGSKLGAGVGGDRTHHAESGGRRAGRHGVVLRAAGPERQEAAHQRLVLAPRG